MNHIRATNMDYSSEDRITGSPARAALALPLALCMVPAGFPSPADDFMEKKLDLTEHIITNPPSTFLVTVTGDSMTGGATDIHAGDILVVDRAAAPQSGKIVIALLNGEFTVKKLLKRGSSVFLVPDNPAYPEIPMTEGDSLEIWGTVTWVLRKT